MLAVVAAAGVPAQPGHDDGVQGAVCLSVSTLIESTALGLARGRFDGTDTAQGGEGRLAVESLRVISGRDKEHGRGVWAHPVMVDKLRGVRGEHLGDPLVPGH